MFEVFELDETQNLMKSYNVIIYGTIRDIEDHFIKSFKNIDLLCNFFNNAYIIIFENDSKDETRNLLTKWGSSSNGNVVKHVILENNLNAQYPLRAHRLAYCRNRILNYIFENKLNESYQYAIHCDLDDRFWSLDYESICNCFQYDTNCWDAMFPINNNYTYYDFWALRCNESWFQKNIFCCEIENNEKCNEFENHVGEFSSFLLSNKNTLIQVHSAFNGIGIYKLSSLYNCRYNADYMCGKCNGQKIGCYEDNDHIGLHKSMIANNCKLYINTKMMLESKAFTYQSYSTFMKNLKNIPNIGKDPLQYVLYSKLVDTNHIWVNGAKNMGIYENKISNFTSNPVCSFCIEENTYYINDFINNNVIKYSGNLSKNICHFILHNQDALISFIHIDFNNYHQTINLFNKLYKKINNNCIIVLEKYVNFNEYLLNDLHAFYEFVQKYNIVFEYIGMNGSFSKSNHTGIAIKINNNPNISKIDITSDFFKYEDECIYFDWIKYKENHKDLVHVRTKEDAWEHWLTYGKREGRTYCEKSKIKETNMERKNFDWQKYAKTYKDLNEITTKEEAWHHWIYHGKKEGRQYFTNESKEKNESNDKNESTESEKNNFDWKKYIQKNEDLSHIKEKEQAWHHWIYHGKKEGRTYYEKKNIDSSKNFDWKFYIENNPDLSHIQTEEEALYHWNHYGKNEGRNYMNKNFVKFNNFDWKYYVENNQDLNEIKTKDEAWDHWINHGQYENRLFKKKLKKQEFIF